MNSEIYGRRAVYFINAENWEMALSDISKAIRLDSTRSDYYTILSDIYLGTSQLRNSVEALDKAVVMDPDNIEALLKYAELSIVFQSYDKSISYTDKVLSLDRLNPHAYYLKGIIHMEMGDTASAIVFLRKACDIDQDFTEAMLQLGILHTLRKEVLAIDYFRNILNLYPAHEQARYHLAMFLQEKGQYEQAINQYLAITEYYPELAYPYYNIGYIQMVYLRDFDQAIHYFTETVRLDPEFADAYYNRGFSYELKKDVVNSLDDYRRTLELDPSHEKATNGLRRINNLLSR
ncbi:MAG: tetratricopeptide repeat protein [Bacteroidales bacterium]|nr:tetratricopeptide repeat protein [Bacteroidales bacterium]